MKKKFSLLFVLFSFISFGQYQSTIGNLTIFSENGDAFFMYLNGELQNETPQTNIRVEDLNHKFYSVKIQFQNKTLKEIQKNYVSVVDNNGVYGDVTYKIKVDDKNKKTRLNYFSSIPVDQSFNAPEGVYVVRGVHNQTPPIVNTGVNIGGVNINIKSPGANNQGQNSNPNPRQSGVNNRGCLGNYEMSSIDFENAKKAIAKENFSDAKLKIMFQIIQNNCLNTYQISQFIKLQSFDDDRLKTAKFALDYCIDPQNYYSLNSLLTYNSSKNELIDYVQS